VLGSRISVSVSSRIRSGGSSWKTRVRSDTLSRCRSEVTSSEIVNPTAQRPVCPSSSIAWRASCTPARATSSQCGTLPPPGATRCSTSGVERIDHVLVEIMLQPAAT
jgi:hypothetical protein